MHRFLSFVLLFSVVLVALGQPPAEKLPPGALAQLGTPDQAGGNLEGLRFSADGKTLRSLHGRDGMLCEWDANSGTFLRSEALRWPGGRDHQAYSPDLTHWCGRGQGLGAIQVVERLSGKIFVERSFEGVATPAPVAFSSDGERVLIQGRIEPQPGDPRRDLGYAVLWDYRKDTIRRFEGLPDGLTRTRLAPDDRHLATAVWVGFGSESEIARWEVATGRRLWAMRRPGYVFGTPAFSPDGLRLVVPIAHKTPSRAGLEILDTATGRLLVEWATGQEAGISGEAVFSPDGATLFWLQGPLVRPPTHTLVAIDPVTGKERFRLDGARGPLAFASDGKSFVTSDPLQRWNMATGKPLWPQVMRQSHLPAVSLALSSDGKQVAWRSDGPPGKLSLWDPATGQVRAVGERLKEPLCYAPDGKTLIAGRAAGYGEATLVAVDPTTGKEQVRYSCAGVFEPTWNQVLHHVEFRPGNRLRAWMSLNEDAVGQGTGWIEWDIATGKVVAKALAALPVEAAPPRDLLALATTLDRATSVRLYADRLEVWDEKAGRRLKAIAAPASVGPWTGPIALDTSGQRAVTTHRLGLLLLWDLRR